MLKLVRDNQEEFERQLELVGMFKKFGYFLKDVKNRHINPNSDKRVSEYSNPIDICHPN